MSRHPPSPYGTIGVDVPRAQSKRIGDLSVAQPAQVHSPGTPSRMMRGRRDSAHGIAVIRCLRLVRRRPAVRRRSARCPSTHSTDVRRGSVRVPAVAVCLARRRGTRHSSRRAFRATLLGAVSQLSTHVPRTVRMFLRLLTGTSSLLTVPSRFSTIAPADLASTFKIRGNPCAAR